MSSDISGALIVSSAISGAAAAFVTLLANKGVDWLIELVAAHSPAVQAKAKENMENFLYRLAERVERLEHELPIGERSVIKDAMEHPSTAFLICDAMKNAAVTDSQEHHALLAELIAQRLGAGADDMITLVGTAACDVVNSLSVRQIYLLATLALLLDIRPLVKIELNSVANPNQDVCDWWEKNLLPVLDLYKFDTINALDLEHLVAMRCMRISTFGRDLIEVLSDQFFDSKFTLEKAVLEKYSVYDSLLSRWNMISSVNLTSIGKLIGILHRDTVVKSKTTITW